jgi:L-ascorbate metabolism protein UlaG (beta-lactamase superfamily)
MSFRKQFGGKLTKEHIAQYEQSPNWKNGVFENLVPADAHIGFAKLPSVIYKQLTNRRARQPQKPLTIQPFDPKALFANPDQAQMIWYGHSVLLLRMGGMTILIDPMLGSNTTPMTPMPTKRFSENTLQLIDDFPEIDLVLLTHDHYDHLDYASIMKLHPKVKQWGVALGVKRHLEYWGVAGATVTEFDWWQEMTIGNLHFTFTPTRHFAGRGFSDRNKSLWGGWVLQSPQEKIWFSGDGGYGKHFKEVGERLGPFDFALLECGQYNNDWAEIHLFPQECIQAALDTGTKNIMPVHWAGFALSYQHTWQAPAEDFVKAAEAAQLNYTLPRLGEIFNTQDRITERWWRNFK